MKRAAPPDSLGIWRLEALNWILRGQFIFWLLAWGVSTWNAILAYQAELQKTINTINLLVVVITIYLVVLLTMAMITFSKRIGYRWRVFVMLGVYYFLSVVLFSLSALSGDARGFLFAFVVLAAVFLDRPWNFVMPMLALFTFATMGWLHISGFLNLVPGDRFNAADPSAWISGGVVFATLSVSVALTISHLLFTFRRSMEQTQFALQSEQSSSASLRLLGNINQLIVREHTPKHLFDEVCRMIVERGYAYAWVGKLQPDENELEVLAYAGTPLESASTILKKSRCVIRSLQNHQYVEVSPLADEEICMECPLLSIFPERAALALPLQRETKIFGTLVVARTTESFKKSEILLLKELADDLAYALENIETETQRHALAETASNLLTTRSEVDFWPIALQSVRTILHADRSALFLYNSATKQVSCPYSMGLSKEYIDEIILHFREEPDSYVLQFSRPVPVDDIESSPMSASFRFLLQREGIRSYVVFPLFSANKLFGTFVAYRNTLAPFSQPDLQVGQTLAHLVGTSLQNTLLFSETRTKASEQAILYAAAQDMASSLLKPQALLKIFASHLASALDATSAYIVSLDSISETLTVLAEYWSDSALATERKSDIGRNYKVLDFGFIKDVKLGKIVIQKEDDLRLLAAEREEFKEYGVKSKIFVPLMSQGRLVGHTEIWESRYRREFTQNELNLAQAMSVYAANIIENARLFEMLEHREGYFRTLIENSAEGVAVLDKEGILRYLATPEKYLTGASAQELIGQSAFSGMDAELLSKALQVFHAGIQQPDGIFTFEYRLQQTEGKSQYFEATGHNMLDNPHVNGVVINFRDITERKQAELKIQQQADEIIQAYDATLVGWARALELRDRDTEGHTRRVTQLTEKLARNMGIPNGEIIHIRRGSLLHDIGKVAVPDYILNKPGPLSDAEMEIMRQHPSHAYEMLSAIPFLQPALDIPYCHHEKWDGTGYPRRLQKEEIPMTARIFSVVDVWDALTSDRPYRAAWDKETTIEYIAANSGKSFDPRVVDAFLSMID